MTGPGPCGRLDGYRVAVLGGGGVLGAAAARACGREGAAVAVGYRSSAVAAAAVADEITAGGGTAFAGPADVTDARSVGGFIDAAAGRLGGLDVLVNAFGRIDAADAVRFAQTTAAAWDELFAVDVRGLLLACQAASSAASAREAPGSTAIESVVGSPSASAGVSWRGEARPRGLTLPHASPALHNRSIATEQLLFICTVSEWHPE